jgi:hypothetical protein
MPEKGIFKGLETNFLEELFNTFCYIADISVSGKGFPRCCHQGVPLSQGILEKVQLIRFDHCL